MDMPELRLTSPHPDNRLHQAAAGGESLLGGRALRRGREVAGAMNGKAPATVACATRADDGGESPHAQQDEELPHGFQYDTM